MTTMPTDLMMGLRDLFATYFDVEGLTDFALALDVDYENLSGSTKSAKARELALHLWRHSKLAKLAEVGPTQRPDIDWSLLRPYVAAVPLPPDDTQPKRSTRLKYTDIQKLLPVLAAYQLFQTPDGRNTLLMISGIAPYVSLDLNGSAQLVASSLLVKLNEYGEIGPGDTAIGRLLAYVAADAALPPSHKDLIATIATKYGLQLG
ncbi:MAG: hypothetical protein KA586_02610 [Candidatus Promineofilum sp.]|nr:hypothetical protein [Promineifilum sp.]